MREDRKHNIDDNHTFKPQINKRPTSDSLDALASQNPKIEYSSNDLFEQPLPGAGGYKPPPMLSPGSDALGSELKRHGVAKQPSQESQQYRSKFMQQYEQQANSRPEPPSPQPTIPQRSKYDIEAEETFSQLLRGSDKSSKVGAGWNNNVDTPSSGFGEPKPVSYKRRPRKETTSNTANMDYSNPPPRGTNHTQSTYKSPNKSNRNTDWNFDTEVNHQHDSQSNNSNYGVTLMKRDTRGSQASSNNHMSSAHEENNNGYDYNNYDKNAVSTAPADVSQARSRLSLLKSKMRKSDSDGGGGDLRSASAKERLQQNDDYNDMNPSGGKMGLTNHRNVPITQRQPVMNKNGRENGSNSYANDSNGYDEEYVPSVHQPSRKGVLGDKKKPSGLNSRLQQQQDMYGDDNDDLDSPVMHRQEKNNHGNTQVNRNLFAPSANDSNYAPPRGGTQQRGQHQSEYEHDGESQ